MKIYEGARILEGRLLKEPIEGDIYDNTFIGCPIEIGEKVHISANCSFVGQGKLILEDLVTISPGVVIYTSSPDFGIPEILFKNELPKGYFAGNKYVNGFKVNKGDVRIMEGTFLGANCIIHQGVTIGKYCIVGAGAFVKESMPSYHVALGNPATYFKRRSIAKEELTRSD